MYHHANRSSSDVPFPQAVSYTQIGGSSSTHHVTASPSIRSQAWNYGKPRYRNHVSVHHRMSMPLVDDEDDKANTDVHRTFSGGLIMRRRTLEEQKRLSQNRSFELSVRFELSDVKDTDLNKNGKFKVNATNYTGAPSLQTISPKEAIKVFENRKRESDAKKQVEDPLLSAHEKKKLGQIQYRQPPLQDREIKGQTSRCSALQVNAYSEDNRGKKFRASLEHARSSDDENQPGIANVGRRVLNDKNSDNYSVEVVTKGTGIFYIDSNGKMKDLPNLC